MNIQENVKTFVLLAGLTAILIVAGYFVAGATGALIALVFALLMNGFAYWNSAALALRGSRAVPLSREDAPELHEMLDRLCVRAGLPVPSLHLIPSPVPNAFATGRNPQNAAVAVTEGLLQRLNKDEVEGVIAHELAHIQHRDILTSSVAAVIAGAITGIANIAMFIPLFQSDDEEGEGANPLALMLFSFLAPLAAMIVQMAVSRAREYAADATAARITGRPEALASALERLHLPHALPEPTPQAAAHAHMYIANPLKGGGVTALFSTHPPYEERVRRLRSMNAA